MSSVQHSALRHSTDLKLLLRKRLLLACCWTFRAHPAILGGCCSFFLEYAESWAPWKASRPQAGFFLQRCPPAAPAAMWTLPPPSPSHQSKCPAVTEERNGLGEATRLGWPDYDSLPVRVWIPLGISRLWFCWERPTRLYPEAKERLEQVGAGGAISIVEGTDSLGKETGLYLGVQGTSHPFFSPYLIKDCIVRFDTGTKII